MKNIFNQQLTLALSLILTTFTTLSFAKDIEKPSIYQPLATGVSFQSDRDNYQLMPGVFAKPKQQNLKNQQKSLSLSATRNIEVLDEKAGLEIYRSTNQIQTKTLSTTGNTIQAIIKPSKNEKMVVYNPRTKNIGIVMGTIVVKYKDKSILKTLEQSYGIKLGMNFAHIKFAFFTPKNIADIFTITKLLKKDSRVVSADIEVLENINKLY